MTAIETLTRLEDALRTAGVPFDGVALTGPGAARVDYAAGATDPQRAAGAAVLGAFDWSDAAHAAWAAGRATVAAVAWLAASPEPAAVALRVVLRDVYTAINDERESRSLARVLEPEIAARLVAAAQSGAGAPIDLGG